MMWTGILLAAAAAVSAPRGPISSFQPGGLLWGYRAHVTDAPVELWKLTPETLDTSFVPLAGANGRGIAVDTRDGNLWVTAIQVGTDIYKVPPRGGAIITSLAPPPAGVTEGIGALDFDSEDNTLWATTYACAGGICDLYQLDPSSGNVLRTCSFAATGGNDSLAIAHPADLGGQKVLLTDGGEYNLPTLIAIDPVTCAQVKTYSIPSTVMGITGIDEADNGHLVAVEPNTDYLSPVTLYDFGPGPYNVVLGTMVSGPGFEDIAMTPDVPLAVRFGLWSATVETGGRRIAWTTLAESGTLGFEVERAPSAAGPFRSIAAMIEARGSGSAYALLDPDIGFGPAWYRVVERTDAGLGDATPAFTALVTGGGARRRGSRR